MAPLSVVGMGAMNLDRFYRVERFISEGEATVMEASFGAGGSAANTIYALAKLGINTGYLAAVGQDTEGERLLKELASVGVDTRGIRVKLRAKTGEVLAIVNNQGRRALYVLPGANNLLTSADIDLDYLRQASYLHLSSFAGEEQLQLQKEIVNYLSPQTRLSLAPGMLYARKGMPALIPLLRKAYITFLNAQELKALTGQEVPAGARYLHQEGSQLVVVTLGGGRRGVCYIWNGQEEYRIKPKARVKEVVDTTGAGDAFCAGFLYGLLQGESLTACALMAEVMATSVLNSLGARSGLPSLRELQALYRELKA